MRATSRSAGIGARGPWPRWATDGPAPRAPASADGCGRAFDVAVKFVAWPVHVRGWWATLRRELPPADLYHAFGILTVPVALALARRARRSGGRAGSSTT